MALLVCFVMHGNSASETEDVTCSASTQKFLPNIGFLGQGYNVYKAFPEDLADPGFTGQQIRDNINNGLSTTDDQRYCIPEGVNADLETLCDVSTRSRAIHGAYSFGLSLAESLDLDDEGFAGWFSFHTNFNGYVKDQYSKTERETSVRSVGECICYQATLTEGEWHVSDAFIETVKNLPADYENNEDEYYQFIDTFGTHYTSTIYMGSKLIFDASISEAEWSNSFQAGFSLTVNVKDTIEVDTLSTSSTTTAQVNIAKEYSSYVAETDRKYIGATIPSSDKTVTKWYENTLENPYPVKYKLQKMTEAFDSMHWSNSVEYYAYNVEAKKKSLSKALEVYCKSLSGNSCDSWNSDAIPFVIYTISNYDHGNFAVFCNEDDYVLSCGQSASTLNTELDSKTYPIKDSHTGKYGCFCYNYFGVDCVARCVRKDLVASHEIVSKETDDFSTVSASCTDNMQVAGCGYEYGWNSGESGQHGVSVYPSQFPAQCECVGAKKCFAVCVSTISDYTIEKRELSGQKTFSCSNGAVLGTGLKQSPDRVEHYPAFYPEKDFSSAGFYDHFSNSVAYLICGSFYKNKSTSDDADIAFWTDLGINYTMGFDYNKTIGVNVSELSGLDDYDYGALMRYINDTDESFTFARVIDTNDSEDETSAACRDSRRFLVFFVFVIGLLHL